MITYYNTHPQPSRQHNYNFGCYIYRQWPTNCILCTKTNPLWRGHFSVTCCLLGLLLFTDTDTHTQAFKNVFTVKLLNNSFIICITVVSKHKSEAIHHYLGVDYSVYTSVQRRPLVHKCKCKLRSL